MKILVINSGSSSLKFKLFSSNKWKELFSGAVDGIGLKTCKIKGVNKISNTKTETKKQIKNHKKALLAALEIINNAEILKSLSEIKIIGHRVVHGGEAFTRPTKITQKVITIIRKTSELAPLHNPANLEGILGCKELLPKAINVAVFDTAFHQTMPKEAYLYAIPLKMYTKRKIRRYGFHGTSHEYVSKKATKALKKRKTKIISCHIGNGISITAIKDGKSIDTSMGFTPLEGIPMGTRSGDIDPAVALYIMDKENMNSHEMSDFLNHKCGLKALSGISSDMRLIWDKCKRGDEKAIKTLDLLSYRVAKYIGGYSAVLEGADAIVFTAGIGENAWYLRKNIISRLKSLNIKLNNNLNRKAKSSSGLQIISDQNSEVKVMVIPTNEELEIAQQSFKFLSK